MPDPEQIAADAAARAAGETPPPRTLAVTPPSVPTPLNPDYKPATKDEAKSNISLATDRFDEYKRNQLNSNVPIRISDGDVYRWETDAPLGRELFDSDQEYQEYLGIRKDSGGKWVPDVAGQALLDEIEYAERLSKELSGSGGAARAAAEVSYEDLEDKKSDEITRQFKDFAARANLYSDLMADEQEYGFNATDHNISSWKAQRDLGLATMPGGFAGQPSMSQSLSSILRPSLPDYVRPDYRMNAAVGLPGPEGFDDPDYDEYGMPMFAQGTAPDFVPIRPMPIVSWPWRPRGS